MNLLFPDACWNPEIVSGATFLYFRKDPPLFTLHSSASVALTGIDPFQFAKFVEERSPPWKDNFGKFWELWNAYYSTMRHTAKILSPLRGKTFKTVQLSYARGDAAWDRADQLISSSSLDTRQIAQLIDPYSAADELFAHIFAETYLELYEGHRTPEELVEAGKEIAARGGVTPKSVDWRKLYEYCDRLFGENTLPEILMRTAMFRIPMLQQLKSVFLSNPDLVPFLASLPVEVEPQKANEIDLDPIAWEFFRQLTSKHLDPLSAETVAKIQGLNRDRASEIDRLQTRCLKLAEDFKDETDLDRLQKNIAQHIRIHTESEVQQLFSINKETVRDFYEKIAADEKFWAGSAGYIYSLFNGGAFVTAASAICAISSVGPKAMQALAHRNEKLRTSDFALLYRMKD